MKYFLILPLFLFLIAKGLYADTVLLKDGQELKGVVVEDYHDRIVLSTEKGEIGVFKKEIDRISYDTKWEDFVKLGALYKDKGDYKPALYYYEAAYKLNPDSKEARDGISLVTNVMFRKKESDLEKEVALRQDTEERMGKAVSGEVFEAKATEASINKLWNSVGLAIENTGSDIKVRSVLKDSPAGKEGIKGGDEVISIWGKLVKYMQLEEVYSLFLASNVSEIRVNIARDKSVEVKKSRVFGGAEDMTGARLSMELEGLTVSDIKEEGPFKKAGILKGDMITRLGGVSTRYMPLEIAYKIIEDLKGDSLDLEIQREVILWRK